MSTITTQRKPTTKPSAPRKRKAKVPVVAAPVKPVEATTETPVAIPSAGSRSYPAPGDILIPVAVMPKGLGADQRGRWDTIQTVYAQAEKEGVAFTAGYLAKHGKGGRRTLRRACRARLFVGWPIAPVK